MGKKAFGPHQTRLFALAGHRSAGKTSLAEVLLQTTGATRTIGRVEERTSLLDHQPGERRRGMTLEPGFAWMTWRDHLLELVDTPGSDGLAHHRRVALAAVDAAIVVVSGSDGVEYGTERVLEEARALGLPRIAVINRAERMQDPAGLLEALEEAAGTRVLPLQLPFQDDEHRFSGIVNLLEPDGHPRVYRYDLDGANRYSPEPLPERYRRVAAVARERIQEAVALADDALLEEYLEFLGLPPDKLFAGLARLVRAGEIVPVLYTSAALAIGAHPLLDALVDLAPSPLDRASLLAADPEDHPVEVHPDDPFVAQVISARLDEDGQVVRVLRVWSGEARRGSWIEAASGAKGKVQKLYQVRGPRRAIAQTVGPGAIVATWEPLPGRPGATFGGPRRLRMPLPALDPPMMAYLLRPLTPRDEDALPAALDRLCALDPALHVQADPVTGGALLEGTGQMQLDRALELLRRRPGVGLEASLPPVPYRETPASPARRAHGLHRREEGSLVAEFGECWIDVDPREPDDGVHFENAAAPDHLPDRFAPAVGSGIQDATLHGPTAGYPVTGVGVRCVDGEYDILSSEDEHFRQAGALALRAALEQTGTDLLEPWSRIRVEAAATEVGGVLTELGSRRGRILDMEVGSRVALVDALVPYRELRTFAPRLQSITGGRGRFRATHSHYERLPRELVREAIAQSPWVAEGRVRTENAPGRGITRQAEYNA